VKVCLLATLTACASPSRVQIVDLAVAYVAPDLGAAGDLAAPPDLAPAADLARAVDAAGAPHSYGSPAVAPTDPTLMWNGNWAAPFKLTLAADDATAQIYYTLDGSPPTLASAHGLTPILDLPINASTRVRWFAAGEPPHDDSYGVDTTLQSKAGYLTMDTSFEGQGPVLRVSPGQMVNGTSTIRVWYQSAGCGGGLCQTQLVYGVDLADQGCLFDTGASNFAGSGLITKSFVVTAPTATGAHDVQVAHTEQASCASAMSMMTLKSRPNTSRIGVLVVQ
jgi:hypothetical protein